MQRNIVIVGINPDGTAVTRVFTEQDDAVYEKVEQYALGLEASNNYVEVEVLLK